MLVVCVARFQYDLDRFRQNSETILSAVAIDPSIEETVKFSKTSPLLESLMLSASTEWTIPAERLQWDQLVRYGKSGTALCSGGPLTRSCADAGVLRFTSSSRTAAEWSAPIVRDLILTRLRAGGEDTTMERMQLYADSHRLNFDVKMLMLTAVRRMDGQKMLSRYSSNARSVSEAAVQFGLFLALEAIVKRSDVSDVRVYPESRMLDGSKLRADLFIRNQYALPFGAPPV
jgi:hypothetical protein